ncbi:hypothetical protein [Vibrio sp. OPT18]|uniref:hypothetical protein n=1 Tax=Vibrio sp. OPT18 TaxID=2778641 RepID=UPI001880FE7C|nr:hypothetical protein [Vibrio sp. OPT18]MBE8578612.1 hypothetical protein [Vibrio sp. OPT18]
MFDVEKIMAFLKEKPMLNFSAKDIAAHIDMRADIRNTLTYLVGIGAVSKSVKKGYASLYRFKAEVNLALDCKGCNTRTERRLILDNRCPACRRKTKGSPMSVSDRRDKAMKKFMCMPFGLKAAHYVNIFKDEHYDTR